MRKYYLNDDQYYNMPMSENSIEKSDSSPTVGTVVGGALLADKDKRAFEMLEAIAKYLGNDEHEKLKNLISNGYNLRNLRSQCSEPMEGMLAQLEFFLKALGNNDNHENIIKEYKESISKVQTIQKSMQQGPMGLIGALSGNPMLPMLMEMNKNGSGNSQNSENSNGLNMNLLLPLLSSMGGNMNIDAITNMMKMMSPKNSG